MAWIESHQELAGHPKTKRFRRALGVSVPMAIGHLHLLWWWALDYAQDGDLSRYEPEDVADAAMWEGDASQFLDALATAGFVDRDGKTVVLHDWDEYAGRLIQKREQNRERQRRSRERNASVTHDNSVSHGATQQDQDQTQPEPTKDADGDASAHPGEPALDKPPAEAVEPYYVQTEPADEFARLLTAVYKDPDEVAVDEIRQYVDETCVDVVTEALKDTIANTPEKPRPYFRRVMQRWIKSGVKTLADLQRLRDEKDTKQSGPSRASPKRETPIHRRLRAKGVIQ